MRKEHLTTPQTPLAGYSIEWNDPSTPCFAACVFQRLLTWTVLQPRRHKAC